MTTPTPTPVTPDLDWNGVGIIIGTLACCLTVFSILIMIAGKGRGR